VKGKVRQGKVTVPATVVAAAVNQSIHQSIGQSVNQSISQSVNQPICRHGRIEHHTASAATSQPATQQRSTAEQHRDELTIFFVSSSKGLTDQPAQAPGRASHPIPSPPNRRRRTSRQGSHTPWARASRNANALTCLPVTSLPYLLYTEQAARRRHPRSPLST
jgi:hypothetical protein